MFGILKREEILSKEIKRVVFYIIVIDNIEV